MRGLVSSSTAAGTTIGFILGSASAWLVNATLAPAGVARGDGAFRLSRAISFCVVGWLLRRGIHETSGRSEGRRDPPADRCRRSLADWRPIVQTFGIVAMTNAAYYLTFTYAVERRKRLTGEGGEVFLLANTLSLFVVLFAKPLGGWLSDRVGRRRLMIALTVVTMSLIYVALRRDAVRIAARVHRRAAADGGAAWHGARACRARWSSRSSRCGRASLR